MERQSTRTCSLLVKIIVIRYGNFGILLQKNIANFLTTLAH